MKEPSTKVLVPSISRNETFQNIILFLVWTDEDLVAQAILFFIAGFDSVATVMTFVLMELALNPECQDKLVEEIRETDSKSGGFDYNSVQQMKYLDMVVSGE